MAKAGRPFHVPTKAQRDTVTMHSVVGTSHRMIAAVLKIDENTLRKHYRDELDLGLAQANAVVGGALYNKAKNGETVAQIFWMKARAGWNEKSGLDITSSDDSLRPMLIEIVSKK